MNLRTLTQAGGMALILALAPTLHAKDSGDCDVAIDLGKKPEMGDHSQLNAFIAAALEYKSQQRKQDQHRKSCPELYEKQPVLWIDDPTVTQGPETLDSAVERSESFPSLDYGTTDEWYGRSTSQSFSLSDAGTDELADSLIQTPLFLLQESDAADAAPSADEESAILLALATDFDSEKGIYADKLVTDQLAQTLFFRERDAESALGTEPGEFVNIQPIPSFFGGFALFSDASGENELVTSRYEMESCLSSCGEFGITLLFP